MSWFRIPTRSVLARHRIILPFAAITITTTLFLCMFNVHSEATLITDSDLIVNDIYDTTEVTSMPNKD